MTSPRKLLLITLTACVANAWGQSKQREPHIGYLYPSGGRQGTIFQIAVGGQILKNATNVNVSGEGVHASVIKYYKPFRNLNGEQSRELQRLLKELTAKQMAKLPQKDRTPSPRDKKSFKNKKNTKKPKITKKKDANKTKTTEKKNAAENNPAKLPDHPLLQNLENKSLRQLQHVKNEFFNRKKRQLNLQIAESVVVEVTIDPDAEPGNRELRLITRNGLTNPMCFQVGMLPEIREQEPNDPQVFTSLPKEPTIGLPVLLNGQIMPGDVDRFRFRAKRGQPLVIQAQARKLIPYLADAVPGWFQATLALYNDQGKEVAFTDDYRFDPDPVLFYKIPQTGEYQLEIRDAIYRGREDFVYRIAVGVHPFVTQTFPLGGRTGDKTSALIDGWNLPTKRLRLDTKPGPHTIRQTAFRKNKRLSNPVTYAVNSLPEVADTEPNDTTQKAQQIELPLIVNGRIAKPGDVDVFQFKGRPGQQVVAEVLARRLNSPLDSLLRITDASGQVLKWNDDHEDKESGLCTHHADSYLTASLPKDGTYYVHLADSQHHGGKAFGYRLRIHPPQPDFTLRMTPSSISVPAGSAVQVHVHALRKDGFNGHIELVLKDPPPGFKLNGGRIPSGLDRVRMTLTAPWRQTDQPTALQLEGKAQIDGKIVRRPVVPAEDMMQAFLYRHLTPSKELMIAVIGGKRRGPPVELLGSSPVRIPAGGSVKVRFKTPKRQKFRDIRLQLSEPPKGLTLQDVNFIPQGLTFLLKADNQILKPGFADNLIVEAFTETPRKQQGPKKTKKKQRISLGILPAIPIEIVKQ
ncbi:MAG: hypothetical protein ACYTF1_02365 [Planctomycetota bacterium]|jgi:hypothetical protein